MTTYHFLDESGDPGLSSSRSASTYLALAIIELETREPLPILTAVRDYLHLPSRFEFKYHTTTKPQREVFFRALEILRFRVDAAVLSKADAPVSWQALDGEERVVDLAACLIMRNAKKEPGKRILVVDGAKSRHVRTLRTQLSLECRARSLLPPYARILSGDSATEDGLQVADMLVGSVRHYAMTGEKSEVRTFSDKIGDLWLW